MPIAAPADVRTWHFEVTVDSGTGLPIGTVLTGSVSLDDSGLPLGVGISQTGLVTDLSFTFDGIEYDETTANTGFLQFNADGSLFALSFGTNCDAGGCASGNPGEWFLLIGSVRVGDTGPDDFDFAGFTASSDIVFGDMTFEEQLGPTETITFAYAFEASNFGDDLSDGTPSPVEFVSGSFGFTYERGAGDPVSIVTPDFVNLSIFGFDYASQDTVVRIFDNGGNVTVIFGGAPSATSSAPFTNDFQLAFLVSPSGDVLLPFSFSYRVESLFGGWFTFPPDLVINQRLLDPISLINLLAADMIGTGPGTSFTDKLLQARAYVEAGDDQAACEMLNAFLNQVSAQNGKKLTADEASQAESDANAIAELIGCD